MTVQDTVNRIYREFKRYTGDGLPSEPTGAPLPVGDPSSGVHNPKKSELRAAFIEIIGAASESADEAEAALAEFERLYLGALANDADATAAAGTPIVGQMYFNTTSGKFRVWTGVVWQDQSTALSDGDVTFPKLANAAVQTKAEGGSKTSETELPTVARVGNLISAAVDPVISTIVEPALDLVLTAADSLLSSWFTRASTATYFDAGGVLRSAAINVPRFEFDPDTREFLGLLIEGARTNIATYSEQFDNAAWTTLNSTVSATGWLAPDGQTTADKILETAVTNFHGLSRTFTVTNGVAQTFSVKVKAAERSALNLVLSNGATFYGRKFDLSAGTSANTDIAGLTQATSYGIRKLPNGWYRCWITVTSASTSVSAQVRLSNGGDSYLGVITSGLYIWGGQMEAGDFPSSYIPTVASSVTRAEDAAEIPIADFAYNALELAGTLYAEFRLGRQVGGSTTRTVVTFDDETTNERIGIVYNSGSGLIIMLDVDGGVVQANTGGATGLVNTLHRTAFAWATNSLAISTDGGAVTTDAAATIPTVTKLQIGRRDGGDHLFGHLARLDYFPKRLANADLIALTS